MASVYDEEQATEGVQTPLRSSPNASAVSSQREVILKWDNLTYEVKSMTEKDSWRTILHGISGEAHAGDTIAIIGSSGAGKTTLLNALSGRIIGGRLSGSILYRGAKRHPGHFKRISAYVQQDDLMHPLLTVQETLAYASRLRLPNKHYNAQTKSERVNTVIRQLRLEAARNTRIGDAKVRGVSGGERKRVSIGTELLTDPRLLFLDEPTSGLDSNSSELVVELVKSISQEQGIATLMTIHQPNARIFNTFDKVILLSQGRVVYFGPTATAIDYFADLGYQCPMHENPADYFVDLMTLDYRTEKSLETSKKQVQDLADKFSEYSGDNEKSSIGGVEKGLAAQGVEISPEEFDIPRNNWLYEYSTLAKRDWVNILRNVPFLSGQIVQSVFMSLLIGFMFFYLKHDAPSVQNRLGVMFIIVVNSSFPIVMPLLTLFFSERDIMIRERSSATFRVTTFYVSKVTTYLPIAYVCNIFFFVGVYFISHLTFDAGKFFIGLATFFCNSTVSIAFLLLVGAAVKTMDIGFIIAPAVLTIQLLFGGLFANPATITPVLRWIRWINPIQYGFSALVQNEFRGLEFECNPGEQCYDNGQQVIDAYGVGRFTIWQNILMLLMLGVVDAILGYTFLRWVAKPRSIWL
ncbi:hypothetical protein GGH19_003689 [Coemansia sp. RSA 1807]|nr:hypothetical protein LPJ58_000755 [Coemansia sp. RSA 1591]KAJ1766743.1 hypothetical protein LPJ69_000755 [Coemansia sp. RSA 1752]KAJ1794471.1 hypothetical protein LPJ67_000725 [Coemansia sp. RSA 1938]KAJ2140819.1 hypothetical protein IW142_005190 [Coemansia sp. RSA 564]KAJ2447128.1 hypothetical protein IWW46_000499 [Coemansia sp. RSA 2440]KAJ2574590.1 hypothetical protein GGH19_003689 [Coemansia sp. RSA 1807]